MFGQVEVLLCDEHALCRDLLIKVRVRDPQVLGLIKVVHTTKEVLVNLFPIGLGDKPGYKLALLLLSASRQLVKTYIIAISWRLSGNHFDQCCCCAGGCGQAKIVWDI